MFDHPSTHTTLQRFVIALLGPALALSAPAFAQALADPLRPAASAVAPGASVSGTPVLSMIVIRKDRSYVVLDGSVRRLGEHFGGYRLARIEPTQASLVSDDGQRLVVSLLPLASVKQSSGRNP